MLLKQMKYFITVVDLHSFTEAAEQCFISQSAISQQIKALEKELGPEQVKRITDRIKAEDIETAVKMIEASKKPYVFVGGGAIASGADAQLNEFVHKIDSPVADTLMGKGAFNGTDP